MFAQEKERPWKEADMLYIQERHVWTEDAGQTLQRKAKLVERFLQLLLTSTAVNLPGANRALGPPLVPKHLSTGSCDAVQHLYSPLTCPAVPLPVQGEIRVNTVSATVTKFWSSDTDHFQRISPILETSDSALCSQTGSCLFLSALKYYRYKTTFTFYPSSILYWAFVLFPPPPPLILHTWVAYKATIAVCGCSDTISIC